MTNNIDKDSIEVEHKNLIRFNDDSMFRSNCPVCEDGILLVRRDNETFKLLAEDRCIACGQRVIYTDIDELQKGDIF